MDKIRSIFKFTCLLITVILTGCHKSSDDSVFNGEIRLIDDVLKTEKVKLKEVKLDGPFYGVPSVCDSFMIFWNTKLAESFFNAFNPNTGEYIGDFCNKGGGPEDAYDLPLIYQFYIEKEDITTLLYAHHEKKLMIWNISKSVEHRKTVFDTIIPYKRTSETGLSEFLYMFRLDEDTMVTYVTSELLSIQGDMASTPYYQKRTIYSNQPVRDYKLYNKEIIKRKGNSKVSPNFFYSSFDCIKPDGSKIVQGMRRLCQINIIDLTIGQVTGYRIKNTCDFSIFNTDMKDIKDYYTHIQADDNYIYALYLGEKTDHHPSAKPKEPHIVHLFDWNGNLIKKIDLDHPIHKLAIDRCNNLLYVLNAMEDRLFVCDLNQLNL
jgi:hypothetical protein